MPPLTPPPVKPPPVTVTPPPVKPPPVVPPVPTDVRNLLFFGNSFTMLNGVPTIVAQLAAADGHARPHVFAQLSSGWTLSDQLQKITKDGAGNVIDRSLPAGAHWDDVILQDNSLRPTSVPAAAGGDLKGFRADALQLSKLVHAQSPSVQAVMFETWARGAASAAYPASFASPLIMQNELQANYALAAADINAANASADAAVVSPVGEAWKAQKFARDLYNSSDEYHSSPKGSVLAALVLYRTIYHENTTDISAASVASMLTTQGLTAADWRQLTTVADRV